MLKGIETLKTALVLEAESEGVDKIFFRVVNWKGEELFSSNILTTLLYKGTSRCFKE
jgi:hypothetical protein